MSDFDWSDLDVRLLRLLVAVEETGSITAAAERLGVTQSAVSHLLTKLRAIVGDELFTRAGRGIAATPRARMLAARARDLLRDLERFAAPDRFDPADWRAAITIAANDFQRDALLPGLVAELRRAAPGVEVRVIPSNVPTREMLRDEAVDLVVSPRPPDGADIVQKRLFEDAWAVFHDPAVRDAPKTRADWCAADHATVVYEPRRSLEFDVRMAERGLRRRFVVTAPGFSALPAFVRGSDLLVTAPSLLRFGPFAGLGAAPLPFAAEKMPMYAIWSRRRHDDPAHRWLRGRLDASVKALLARAQAASQVSVSTSRDVASL